MKAYRNCLAVGLALLVGCQATTDNPKKDAYTKFAISDWGVILRDGQPFFPVGFYIDRSTTDDYIHQIEAISEGGAFNIVNLPYNRDTVKWNSFLDRCAQKGIYVVSQMYYDKLFLGQVGLFKNHRAMYGWSIADDADNGHFTVEQLQFRHDETKKLDPNHVTETSLTGYYRKRRDAVDLYVGIADVSCYQCYPITPLPDYDVAPDNALTEAYLRILHYVKAAEKLGKPMILNSQTFSWTDNDPNLDARFPTTQEIRNMVYGGLAAGIKGIISYTFNDLRQQPEQWADFQEILKDIQANEAVLLMGRLNRIAMENPKLVVSHWRHHEQDLLIAVNTSYDERLEVSTSLQTDQQTLTAVSDRLEATLSLKQGLLSGELPPMSVQVFNIK